MHAFLNSVHVCHCFLPSSRPFGTFGGFCLNLLFEWLLGHVDDRLDMQKMFSGIFFNLIRILDVYIYIYIYSFFIFFCENFYSDNMLEILYRV